MSTIANLYYESNLQHFGIPGMKWGIRRYQNKDGTLTAAGRKHQQQQMEKIVRKERTQQQKLAVENLRIQEQRKTAQAKAKLAEEKRQLALDQKGRVEGPSSPKPKTPVADLSDEELTRIIARINLEKTYMALVNPPTPEKKKDNSFWAGVAKKSVENVLSNAASNLGKGMGKKISEKLFETTDDKGDKKAKKNKKKDSDDDDDDEKD